jgi:protein involved in polysaccharide export with SLBB domain
MINIMHRGGRVVLALCALLSGPLQAQSELPSDLLQQSAGSARQTKAASVLSGGGMQDAAGLSSGLRNPVITGGSRAMPSIPVVETRPAKPLEPNEFQKFLSMTTGKVLPIFGQELFSAPPSTFAPAEDMPVVPDYVVGPGDEVQIRAWGQIDMDVRSVVDRNGLLNIPKVGNIAVAGVRYQDLQGLLRSAIGKLYRNFELTVTMGQLRAVQVLVVGQAKQPGSYSIGSMSTVVNALFAVGGPSPNGSMRRIQVKRGGKLVTELDLYDLLLKGDVSKDIRLHQGDVIFIPPVGPLVGLNGSVHAPAVFELKETATPLAEILAWGGGLSTIARGQKVTVERIDNRNARAVSEFSLDDEGLRRTLKDGDLVTVHAITPRFDNTVSLRGYVAQPGRFPWRQGMRVSDVIPEKGALLSRDYWQQRNRLVEEGDKTRATKGLLAKTSAESNVNLISRPEEIAWDYAVIERLRDDLSTTLMPFNLGRAILKGDPADNLLLEPGDNIVVFSQADIRVSTDRQVRFVRLEGEFANPGVYAVQPGETLRQLVERVGGVTRQAYLNAAELTRESTRKQQQERYEDIVGRMEKEFERSAQDRARNATTPEEAAGVKIEMEARRAQFAKLKDMQVKGRIVLELPADGARIQDLPDLPLEDGDRLLIPSTPATVSVFGAVYNESSFLFKADKRLEDYLDQAGGPTRMADEGSTFVLRADGSVASKRDNRWLFDSMASTRIKPGDAIVVPEETERTTWVKSLKDWTQILYQFGLGAAALKTIK